MNKLLLIIQREYMALVARKSFIIMTLLIPVFIVLCGALPALLTELNDSSASAKQNIMVIDQTGKLSNVIESTEIYRFNFLDDSVGTFNTQQFMKEAGESVNAVVVIPKEILTKDSVQVNIYSKDMVNPGLIKQIGDCLDDTLTSVKLRQIDIPNLDKIVEKAQVSIDVNPVKVSENGEESDSSTTAAMLLGVALATLTYMFVLSYGAMIMNSVIEEKTNRIVEVVVSSCKPFQLMMGKIIGVALVGLTQFAIWAVILGTVMAIFGASAGVATQMDTISSVISAVQSINLVGVLLCFVIYFIGGYLLYASLFAGFGSAVDQASDASQFTMPIILVMIVALYAGLGCMENPGGTMAVWCSMIPFTSPIVMMIRLPYGVPFWQLAISIVLLFATAFAMVWVSARIYRTGILRYGKKYTFKDVIKWIK